MKKSTFPNLKVAIIGCGNMARVHMRFLTQYVPKENIAVCDFDQLRLEDFAKAFSVTNTFKDLKQMLNEFKPDVVHIVTPPGTHANLAIECLNKDCHVLIEKPMCLTLSEADEIMKAAERNKRSVCIDHMRIADPLTMKVRNILASGQLGEIVNVDVNYSYDYLKRIHIDPAARWINQLPGGSFFDLMPHVLCIVEDIFPDAVLSNSFTWRRQKDVLTDVHCLLRAAKTTIHVHMSLNVFPLKNYIEFEGTNGILRLDFRNFLVLVRKNYRLPNAVERIVDNLSIGAQYLTGSLGSIFKFLVGQLDSYAGLDRIIGQFYLSIQENGTSPVTAAKAKKLLQLTQEIFHEDQAANANQKEITTKRAPADVLVTGATGFIGRRLVNRLLKEGLKLRVLSHRHLSSEEIKELFDGEVDFIEGNIYREADVQAACAGVKKIYHLAAAMQGDWNYHLDTTVTGTKNVMRAAESHGINEIVYVSTLNVYDARNYPDGQLIDETFPFEPHPEFRGSYSHAKLKAEAIVRDFAARHPQVKVSIFRPGLVYGPGGKTFFGDVGLRFGSTFVVVMGLGNRRLPLIYVDNLIDAITSYKSGNNRPENIFNIVDSDYPSQREYIKLFEELTQKKLFVLYVPLSVFRFGFWCLETILKLLLNKKMSLVYKLDCIARSPRHSTKRIEEHLNWKQHIHFKEGLANTIKE